MITSLETARLDVAAIERYLRRARGRPVTILEARELDGHADDGSHKGFGLGHPWLVRVRHDGRTEDLVFRVVPPNSFGRERDDDRVAAAWLDFHTFNALPAHVPAVDLIARTQDGELQSIADATELILVTAYRAGRRYVDDLRRIRSDSAMPDDFRRAQDLASYLAFVHSVRHTDATLWRRRLRDLVGSGEGILGITGSYPPSAPYASTDALIELERLANEWRWRLMHRDVRLCRVHGDFHPFNILIDSRDKLILLDRSRGEWGEAADDVGCLAVNYLFFALQQRARFEGVFRELHDLFWRTYLERTGDREILTLAPPWLAWRLLVLASPQWYPGVADELRARLLGFARQVMLGDGYDYERAERYAPA